MIDVLVLNYNDAQTTTYFVKSIEAYECIRKILIVDNHSSDDSLKKLRVLQNKKILVVDSGRNGGYGAGNNFGVRYLVEKYNSEHILVCNPDVEVEEKTIRELSLFLKKNSEYAVVAPLMKILKKGNQYSVLKKSNTFFFVMSVEMFFSKIFSPLYLDVSSLKQNTYIDVFSVGGSLFMIDSAKVADFELYDENIFLYFEELVLGLRCEEKKYKVALLPNISFIHKHSVSISKTYSNVVKRHMVYLRSYRYVVKHYFNSNLLYYILSYVMSGISMFENFVWSQIKR